MRYILWLILRHAWATVTDTEADFSCVECGAVHRVAFNGLEYDAIQRELWRVAHAHLKRGGLCQACFDQASIPLPTRKELRQIADIKSTLLSTPMTKDNGSMPVFGDVDEIDEVFVGTSIVWDNSPAFPQWGRLPLDMIGPNWAIMRVGPKELIVKNQPIADISAFLKGKIHEINDQYKKDGVDFALPELPTLSFASKTGLTLFWVWDANWKHFTWGNVSPFALRMVMNLVGSSGTVVDLPNLPKRLTVFTRPFPIMRRLPPCTWVDVEWDFNAAGEPIGAHALHPFTRIPGHTVIGVGPKHPAMDGAYRVSRSLFNDGIAELKTRMCTVDGTVWTRELWKENTGSKKFRARIEKVLERAERMEKRYQAIDTWNTRIFGSMMSYELGGHLKGDSVATLADAEFIIADEFDILTSRDNVKAEMWSDTGEFVFLADEVHNERVERWTDRLTMIHHYNWLLRARISGALRDAHWNTLRSLLKNEEPDFIKFQSISLVQAFSEGSTLNIYSARHDLMREGGVFNMSPTTVEGVIDNRWFAKLKPKTKTVKLPTGATVEIPFDDTYKFPVTASQWSPIKPAWAAHAAGYLDVSYVIEDGFWESTPIGIVTNNPTFGWTLHILGDGDQDDKVAAIQLRSMFDAFITVGYEKKQIPVKQNEIVTVMIRLPIATSIGHDKNGNLALGSEYVILKPTPDEVVEIEKRWKDIPVVDLSTAPIRKDDLTYPCDDKHIFPADDMTTYVKDSPNRCTVCGAWKQRPTNWNSTVYNWDAFIRMANSMAKTHAMGGIGARMNLEMVMYQAQYPWPIRCHGETWIDLFTKAICHPLDIDDWIGFNDADRKLAEAFSLIENHVDDINVERISSAAKPWLGAPPAAMMFSDLMGDHNLAKDEMIVACKGVQPPMQYRPVDEHPEDQGRYRAINFMMRRALWQVQPLPTQKRSATALRPANRGCELPYILNLFNMLVDMAKFRKEQFPMQRAANGSYDHPKKAGNFKVSADAYKVSAQDWDQIGDDADYLLSAPTNDGGMGFSDAYIVELIIAAIRWIYCDQVNDNLSDLWLLNGAFLKRTIKALQVIKTIIPQSEFDSLLEFIPFKP